MPEHPMPLASRLIIGAYVLFNLLIAGTAIIDPSSLDATYRGGDPLTPTREFLWFSIGSFHLVLVATAVLAMWMPRAADRRALVLVNAGFYLWDALTQWGYWGARVGLAPADLHTNAGVSAACAAMLVAAAWRDRDAGSGGAPPTSGRR